MGPSPRDNGRQEHGRIGSWRVSAWWRSSRLLRAATLLLLSTTVMAVVHGGSIYRNFGQPQWEDAHFIGHEKEHIHSVADSFEHGSYWHGLYRPLSTNLYYHLGRRAFAHDLHAYHAISAILFLINILLAFSVCRSFAGYGFSLAAALLFGSRLASAEVPLYTSQFQSLLPVFFGLLALKTYLVGLDRRPAPLLMITTSLLLVLALLSKESMVTLPLFCILLALVRCPTVPADGSSRAWIHEAILASLPLFSLLLWWLLASDHIEIGNNRWWRYEFRPLALAGNGIAYLLSFSNLVMWQVDVPGEITWLHNDTVLAWAHDSTLMQVVFMLLVLACAACLFAVILRRRWSPPNDLVLAALGFALFVAVTAPMLIFKNRMLSYYGYFGHLGTSIMLVALVRLLGGKVWRRYAHPVACCTPIQGPEPTSSMGIGRGAGRGSRPGSGVDVGADPDS